MHAAGMATVTMAVAVIKNNNNYHRHHPRIHTMAMQVMIVAKQIKSSQIKTRRRVFLHVRGTVEA